MWTLRLMFWMRHSFEITPAFEVVAVVLTMAVLRLTGYWLRERFVED